KVHLTLVSRDVALHMSSVVTFIFLFRIPRPPSSTLFPYTTLFRSSLQQLQQARCGAIDRFGVAVERHHLHALLGRERRRSDRSRSEEHTSELQSRFDLVCRLLLEKKKPQVYFCCTRRIGIRRLILP